MTAPDNHIEVMIFPDISERYPSMEISLNSINKVVQKYAENYLWHVNKLSFDAGCLSCQSDTFSYKKDSMPPYIYSSFCFGENVEDEWFIVYLLFQVTKEIPGVIVRVWDSDGEFLLIEAADHIPRWCNPESCSERVFLYKGNIHIVQDSSNKVDSEKSLNIVELLSMIRNYEERTKASGNVQQEIQSKMQGFPDKFAAQFHHAHAYIPLSVAKVLKAQPGLIAHATRAFCQRDALDMKAVKSFPHFSSEAKVLQRLKFTKCLYAMLMSSPFAHASIPPPTSPQHKAHSIGVKLTCGFEILLSQVQDREGRCEKQWNQYLASLHKKGYFKDLLEGSQEYQELVAMARDFYMKHQGGDIVERGVGDEIQDLMQNSNVDLNKGEALEPEDDDAWMNISSQDLDTLLQDRFGLSGANCADPGASRPDVVASAINRFLHHSSGLEGAEFPHGDADESANSTTTTSDKPNQPEPSVNKKSVKFQDQDSTMEVSDTEPCEEEVDFNLDEFSAAITKMLDTLEQRRPGSDSGSDEDSDLSGSDSDDYMKAMEAELSGTTLGQSFVKNDEDDSVNIDMNALQNVIASYEAQIGTPGPASNVLNPMGINIRALLEKKNGGKK